MHEKEQAKSLSLKVLLATMALIVALVGTLSLSACGSSGTDNGGGSGTTNSGTNSGGTNTPADNSQKVTVTVDISKAVEAGDATAKALATAKGGNTYSVTVSATANANVLDISKASGLNVVTATASFGTYVTAIDGLASGTVTAEAGWTFLLNGEMPMTGADSTPVKAGDTITWQYVTSFS